MYEDFAPKLAQVITEFSIPVHPGNLVYITGNLEAEPLITALYEATLRCGGNPMTNVHLPGHQELYFEYATDQQLEFLNPAMMGIVESIDVFYNISAPLNTRALTQVDPQKLTQRQNANRPMLEVYKRRTDARELRWNICGWPTQAGAQQADMGLLAYTAFMYKACALDQDDPVAHWQALRERQDVLVNWLKGKHHAEVKGPGIEMSFDFAGRDWVNCWGDENFPDGEIFTSPVEDSVNGHVEFNFPTNYGGREINGVKLTFKDGVVVEASAEKGEDYLLSQLDLDDGARRLGEFAIGTNLGIQQFTGNTLFDEKIGGTVHMAVGRGFIESQSENLDSMVHWDMVHDMKDGGEIHIDGELFYRAGEFMV
ncbi:MAG: aminopeptidase [Chloroflexi bacterium]|nr:aminopeptidase [Chloroflexota bacterium]